MRRSLSVYYRYSRRLWHVLSNSEQFQRIVSLSKTIISHASSWAVLAVFLSVLSLCEAKKASKESSQFNEESRRFNEESRSYYIKSMEMMNENTSYNRTSSIKIAEMAEGWKALSSAALNANIVIEEVPLPPRKPELKTNEIVAKNPKIIAACIMLASQTYSIPPAILVGIYKTDPGQVGKEYGPLNDGSYDIGVTKINSSILPELSEKWDSDIKTVRKWVRDDACTNFGITAWRFKTKIKEAGNLSGALELYGGSEEYKQRVIGVLRDIGLIKSN